MFLLSIFCVSAKARMPTNPYSFSGPDFTNLLPIDADQMLLIKKSKVKRVFVTSQDYKQTYYINDSGQVYFATLAYKHKKKYTVMDSTYYKYNSRGQVVSIRSYGESYYFDTLAYDLAGRLIYEKSIVQLWQGKRKPKAFEISSHYELLYTSANETCLKDVLDSTSERKIYLNPSNECVKVKDDNSLDSIARITINENEYVLKYYFSEPQANTLKLGQESFYKNGKLTLMKQYERYYEPLTLRHEITYRYDERERLYCMEFDRYSQRYNLFVYDEVGLLQLQVKAYRGTFKGESYNYWYR